MPRRSLILDDDTIEYFLQCSDLEDGEDEDEEVVAPTQDGDASSSDSEDDVPLANLVPSRDVNEGRWTKKKFQGKSAAPSNPPSNDTQPKSPAEYFEGYFDEDLFQKFATATSQYYIAQKGHPMKPQCTSSEIKKFFGVHGMMSCIKCPRMKMYWHQKYKYDPIATAMTRERFFLFRTNLHVVDLNCVDDNEKEKNRLWKIQPVIDAVRNRCLELPRQSTSYSIDEQMIPFSGRCQEKQYVPNKPRPVGLKNFVVTTPQGLVLDFEIYQGAKTDLPDRSFGLGPAVVLRLARTLSGGSLYFDRYFTTISLLRELTDRNLDGTGTIMSNRVKSTLYTFKKDKDMNRGEWEEICSPDGKLCMVKWKDNKSVLMISTAHGADPSSTVSR